MHISKQNLLSYILYSIIIFFLHNIENINIKFILLINDSMNLLLIVTWWFEALMTFWFGDVLTVVQACVPLFVEFQSCGTVDTTNCGSKPTSNVVSFVLWVSNVSTEFWSTMGAFVWTVWSDSRTENSSCHAFICWWKILIVVIIYHPHNLKIKRNKYYNRNSDHFWWCLLTGKKSWDEDESVRFEFWWLCLLFKTTFLYITVNFD